MVNLLMCQSTIKKTVLASAITLSIFSVSTIATVPNELPVTNLQFGGLVYDAGGQFNQAGTSGAFDSAVNLVDDPTAIAPDGLSMVGRKLAPGFDQATASGNIFSFDDLFGSGWEGEQKTTFLTNADVWNDTVDPSVSGAFNYDATLAAMDDEQIAVGMFFSWGVSTEIAVLEVFDCDASSQCKGSGIPMLNGPFEGAIALFNAGLTCSGGFSSTSVGKPVSINIAEDILGTDTTPSNCNNPIAADPKDNPAGLKVDGVVSPAISGGIVIINGTVIDYIPMGGFEGSDSFTVSISDDTGLATSITYTVQVGGTGTLYNNFSIMNRSGNTFGGTNDVNFAWDETSFNTNVLDANGSATDTNFGLMSISSPEPLFNFNWVAHHVRIFKNDTGSAITYKFDVTCEGSDYDVGIVDCDKPLADQKAIQRFITMTLETGEIGGHILFDWGKPDATTCGKAYCDIDVVNKWSAGQWDKHGATGNKNVVWIGPAGVPPATVENSGDGRQANWVLVSGDVNGDGINASPMVDGAFEGSYANFNYKPRTPIIKIIDTADSSRGGSVNLVGLGLLSLIGLVRRKALS